MAGATGDALEWALALLQAPGQRHALRGQPLPTGMERLLAIAADGDPAALAGAARTYGESEARLQEAARFYIRQVLFHPEADAYRVLGARPDADADTLKVHHRLLQRWLHPDRISSSDDAVFATRVNQAWQQLRTAARRQAYDASLPGASPGDTRERQDRVPAMPAWTPAIAQVQPPGHGPWRQRAPVVALVLACAVLVVMALRDGGTTADPWAERDPAVAEPASLGALAGLAEGTPEPATTPASPSSRGARPARNRAAGKRAADGAPAAALRPGPMRAPVASAPAAAGLPRDAVEEATLDEAPPVVAALPSTVAAPAGQPLPAAGQPPRAAENRLASRLSPAVESPAVESPARPPAGASTPGTGRNRVSPAGALPDLARVQSAQAAGRQLLRYLQARRGRSPPIWTSPALQVRGQAVRDALQRDRGARLGPPQWRIGPADATLRAAVEPAGGGSGRVVVDLAWREDQWLVTDLRLEPRS